MAKKSPLKLNLGCGYDHRKGWVNSDIDPATKPDLIHDITKPLPYKNKTVDAILAQDVLEHVTLEQAGIFLADCERVLKESGTLTVRVPNVTAIYKKYAVQPDLMMHFLYGNTEKNGVWGAHKYGYTPALMRSIAWRHRLRITRTTTIDTNWEFELQPSTEPLTATTLGNLSIPLREIKKILPWKTGQTVISSNPFALILNRWLTQSNSTTVWTVRDNQNILLLKPFRQLLWQLDLVVTHNQPQKTLLEKQLQLSHLKVLTLKPNH